jgi:hypothetical protein
MKKSVLYIVILFLFFGFANLYSCKKDIEDIPNVTFIFPKENAFYNVGDTIDLKVNIESISNLKSIEFKLVNSDLVPVSSNYNYKVNGSNSITVDYAFFVDDYYMQSGEYQILCKVENEKEVKRKYQKINISAVTRKMENLAVVCKNSSKVQVYNLNSDLSSSSLKFEVNGDYSASTYLPFYHRFALAGSVNGNMICWDYFTGDTIQSIPFSANPPFPFFSSVDAVNDYLAVGYYQGAIDLYNYAAYQKFSIVMEHNYFPAKLFDLGEHFMINEKQINGTKNLVSVRLTSTTSQYGSFLLPNSLISAFHFDGNDDIIFYNDANQGVIAKYVYQDNANNQPVNPYPEAFVSATQIDYKNYLISTSSNLLWYQYQTSSITSIVDNVALDKLVYDTVSGRLYAVEGQNIVVYSIPDGALLNSFNIGKDILAIHLIYNR